MAARYNVKPGMVKSWATKARRLGRSPLLKTMIEGKKGGREQSRIQTGGLISRGSL